VQIFKLASTPADPSRAITEGLRRIAQATGVRVREIEVVHGTTVGTNALLERRGARAGLITTEGFEDVLEIGRQARPALYDLDAVRPEPLVPSALRLGVPERVTAAGRVLVQLDEDALARLVEKLRRRRVESVAVSLLFSFLHPEHERRIERALRSLDVPLSISHRILPEYREYERTSTVVINAYLQPLMGKYLGRLKRAAPRLRVMQSSGGSISAGVAADEPVRTILSGPAGGVVGALNLAGEAGIENLITFDMGGTSTDVALCTRDGMRMTREATVAGMPVAVPIMDIHTVGAGGGSIARVDEGGSLRVGPGSAGADPGPACYGRSLLPTVTDAHLLLNHFGGRGLLGGEFPLDERRAREALTGLAAQMSEAAERKVSSREAAVGVVRVVRVQMERALRTISIERGFDPRAFALLPFCGAGGLHAVELARSLRIPRVVVPEMGGALSARGALSADVVKDWSRTVMLEADKASGEKLARAFREMEREARLALRREGFTGREQRHERLLAVRYKGQSFELEIKWGPHTRVDEEFHREHSRRYGYAQSENVVEVVSARLRAVGLVEKLKTRRAAELKGRGPVARPRSYESVFFRARKRERTALYRREELQPGQRLSSPAIVTEYSATTLIPAGASAWVDAHGNIIIEP
jgi:N-methylhydantoinase A